LHAMRHVAALLLFFLLTSGLRLMTGGGARSADLSL
jgi:hypothetical protein